MDKRLGALMREARKKKGLSQKDLAAELNVQFNTISTWENATAKPNVDSFAKYCKLCGVDAGALLTQVYGDPTKMQDFQCTPDEAELVRRYRAIDERGKRNVRRTLDMEYNDALASLAEESLNATGAG